MQRYNLENIKVQDEPELKFSSAHAVVRESGEHKSWEVVVNSESSERLEKLKNNDEKITVEMTEENGRVLRGDCYVTEASEGSDVTSYYLSGEGQLQGAL
ncbi:hypothetical protein ACFPU1_12990 [Thalassorhabdus alkalitolerans]|uniref:Uncharacterized protein n=1 Tax=Thalassorhabdus alkalitolerans TaxID=2282697 RepID=A0ABW0YMJ8_9BACI